MQNVESSKGDAIEGMKAPEAEHPATDHAHLFQETIGGSFEDADFAGHVRTSAERAGCHFLFEFPAALIDETADQAAAILCPDCDGHTIIFLAYEKKAGRIRLVEGGEAPMKMVDFAFSFARVMTYMPFHRQMSVN